MMYNVFVLTQGGSAAAVFRISSTNVEMRRVADFYRQQDDFVQQPQQQPAVNAARSFPPLVIGCNGTVNVH
jgi:hypothetical protein